MKRIIDVPLLSWLPGVNSASALWMLLSWKVVGISSLFVALTLLMHLRYEGNPTSPGRILRRVAIGNAVLAIVVLACCEITTALYQVFMVGPEVRILEIRLSGVYGIIFGVILSAVITVSWIYFRHRTKKAKSNDKQKRTLRWVRCAFAVLFIVGILNRLFLLGPRMLVKGDFADPRMKERADVYNVGTPDFGPGGDMYLQRLDLKVYEEPRFHADIVTIIPAGTEYDYDGVVFLAYPTEKLCWRYLPSYHGYAYTPSLFLAFRNSLGLYTDIKDFDEGETQIHRLMRGIYQTYVSGLCIIKMDLAAFSNAFAITPDTCFAMSPLSLFPWVIGFIAASTKLKKKGSIQRRENAAPQANMESR